MDAPSYDTFVRPEQLARDLGFENGKIVRSYLRKTFTRPNEAKNTAWVLTPEQANATVKHFVARRSPVQPVAPRTIDDVRAELAAMEDAANESNEVAAILESENDG
jgi:hypothetical protein